MEVMPLVAGGCDLGREWFAAGSVLTSLFVACFALTFEVLGADFASRCAFVVKLILIFFMPAVRLSISEFPAAHT